MRSPASPLTTRLINYGQLSPHVNFMMMMMMIKALDIPSFVLHSSTYKCRLFSSHSFCPPLLFLHFTSEVFPDNFSKRCSSCPSGPLSHLYLRLQLSMPSRALLVSGTPCVSTTVPRYTAGGSSASPKILIEAKTF